MKMTENEINNLLKNGNSKAFIVHLEIQDLERNEGKLSSEQKKKIRLQAIRNVEKAFKKSFYK